TLATRRDRSDDDAVTNGVAFDTGAQRFDASDRLVADHKTTLDGVLALQDVHVGSADRGQGDLDQRLAGRGLGPRNLADLDLSLANEDRRFHRFHVRPRALPRARITPRTVGPAIVRTALMASCSPPRRTPSSRPASAHRCRGRTRAAR